MLKNTELLVSVWHSILGFQHLSKFKVLESIERRVYTTSLENASYNIYIYIPVYIYVLLFIYSESCNLGIPLSCFHSQISPRQVVYRALLHDSLCHWTPSNKCDNQWLDQNTLESSRCHHPLQFRKCHE